MKLVAFGIPDSYATCMYKHRDPHIRIAQNFFAMRRHDPELVCTAERSLGLGNADIPDASDNPEKQRIQREMRILDVSKAIEQIIGEENVDPYLTDITCKDIGANLQGLHVKKKETTCTVS